LCAIILKQISVHYSLFIVDKVSDIRHELQPVTCQMWFSLMLSHHRQLVYDTIR